MHALFLAAALMAAPDSSAKLPSTTSAACKPPLSSQAVMRGAAPGPKRLTEMPDGRWTRAVLRTVGGCDVLEVRTRDGDWRYEPAGKAPGGLEFGRRNRNIRPAQ
ncbi:MAG: hypothetical protein ABIO39_00890 [Caulobacteraceae bacterium]